MEWLFLFFMLLILMGDEEEAASARVGGSGGVAGDTFSVGRFCLCFFAVVGGAQLKFPLL